MTTFVLTPPASVHTSYNSLTSHDTTAFHHIPRLRFANVRCDSLVANGPLSSTPGSCIWGQSISQPNPWPDVDSRWRCYPSTSSLNHHPQNAPGTGLSWLVHVVYSIRGYPSVHKVMHTLRFCNDGGETVSHLFGPVLHGIKPNISDEKHVIILRNDDSVYCFFYPCPKNTAKSYPTLYLISVPHFVHPNTSFLMLLLTSSRNLYEYSSNAFAQDVTILYNTARGPPAH